MGVESRRLVETLRVANDQAARLAARVEFLESRVLDLELAVAAHRDAHRDPGIGVFVVSHRADLPLWAVLEVEQ